MSNFFTDNRDLMFVLDHIDLEEIVKLKEKNYTQRKHFDYAPESYKDAKDNFRRSLEVVGDICGERIEPRAREVDAGGPRLENGKVIYHPLTQANLKDIKDADLCGVMLPREYDGLNFPCTVYTMMTEMVSRADGSLQNLFGLQDIAETICDFGSEEQKRYYLPRFASGEVDGSMDLTEPDSGSDLQSVRLKATLDEKTGKWYLNGMKRFITNGCAKVHLVLARSEAGTTDGRGLSMFICEAGAELVVRRIENKLGIHGVATCELQYNNVPAELCGQRRRGLTKYVMSLMNGARIAISGQAIGIAEAAYREARKYAAEREQFKSAIDKFPAVYEMLAQMRVKIVAARTLLYEATRSVDFRNVYNHIVDHGDPAAVTQDERQKQKLWTKIAAILTPMSKALSTEIGNQVAYDGLQIHGGTGFMKDFNAERFYRDVRITNIYEGTTQLQHIAAIGGVVQRVLDPIIDEYAALAYDGQLKRLVAQTLAARDKHREAIRFVSEKRDSAYHDLMAKYLVENETIVFCSMLLARDAFKNHDREMLVERYIKDFTPVFEKNRAIILSGDMSLIDRHRDIIDY